ncbi:hypothetical protein HALA3H3_p20017 [Halomonas sp. A3H3]|nr:hypothetical protein HALA3H3_p20017 [Halomonas sp. A3H3]
MNDLGDGQKAADERGDPENQRHQRHARIVARSEAPRGPGEAAETGCAEEELDDEFHGECPVFLSRPVIRSYLLS